VSDPIRLVLCDIEGTTTSISFVHDVLFPYARARLVAWVEARASEERVRAALEEARATLAAEGATGESPLQVLLRWSFEDRKHPALKRLQGWIWAEGYAAGALESHLYDDVVPELKRWRAAGLALGVYSSGSVEAQRQLFAHTPAGDLTPLFAHHFDTGVGPKREAASYTEIARRTALAPGAILFLSDIEAELDAAREAGLRTTQLVRLGTTPGTRHPQARDFHDVEIEAAT